MPIYEYECTKGHRFEEIQKISDEPLTSCTQCDQPVRKLISNTAFHLKGGGWYKDGYGSPPASKEKTASTSEGGSKQPDSTKASTPQPTTKKETAQ